MLARREFLGGIGCLLLSSARASDVIRVIVPYAAGGITDIGARVICEQLGPVLGQPVIVENRPGGGTRIGTSAALAAKPDGNTLLLTNIAYSILPLVDPTVKYVDARPTGTAARVHRLRAQEPRQAQLRQCRPWQRSASGRRVVQVVDGYAPRAHPVSVHRECPGRCRGGAN